MKWDKKGKEKKPKVGGLHVRGIVAGLDFVVFLMILIRNTVSVCYVSAGFLYFQRVLGSSPRSVLIKINDKKLVLAARFSIYLSI